MIADQQRKKGKEGKEERKHHIRTTQAGTHIRLTHAGTACVTVFPSVFADIRVPCRVFFPVAFSFLVAVRFDSNFEFRSEKRKTKKEKTNKRQDTEGDEDIQIKHRHTWVRSETFVTCDIWKLSEDGSRRESTALHSTGFLTSSICFSAPHPPSLFSLCIQLVFSPLPLFPFLSVFMLLRIGGLPVTAVVSGAE